MFRQTDPRLLAKFMVNMGWKGMQAMNRFKRASLNGGGKPFPPFMFVSVTNRCNLRCQGCWVTTDGGPTDLPPEALDRIIRDCKRQGSHFFGILGGEPMLYGPLFDVLARHPDCYFQVFTNGTLLDGAAAERMRRLGNITPLISVEGLEAVSDERRGGTGVYGRAMRGIAACTAQRLITGVATSVCKSNFAELVTRAFVDRVLALRVQYLWYYIYRPVGPDPRPDMALDADEILALRRFIVDIRTRVPLVVVDAYWDDRGRALCPAAVGISHHVNPAGEIEPCPPVQFARDNIADAADLADVFAGSTFLRDFGRRASDLTRGCVLLDCPEELHAFVLETGARATSGRDGAAELARMRARPGHHLPGCEVPERSWFYRFAKKNWFFGFGAYG